VHWGASAPRKLSSDSYWQQPLGWNEKARASGEFWPVFCASQADVFDNEVPGEWRTPLWALIRATPSLTWQLLTKRIGNAPRMLPSDSGQGYANVWLVATVANQEEADRDIEKLLAVPAAVHGLSIEPALGPISLPVRAGLDWVIVGGESRQGAAAREFKLEWAEAIVDQCRKRGMAVFVKQMGHYPTYRGAPVHLEGKGDNIDTWPAHLRVQELPPQGAKTNACGSIG
jgi:protein gp37